MKKILLVDDSEETLEFFGRAVSRAFRVRVDFARNENEAVKAIVAKKYDWIIVDVNLSPGCGPRALITAKKIFDVDFSGTKVAIVSGDDESIIYLNCETLEKSGIRVDKTAQKPIGVTELKGMCS